VIPSASTLLLLAAGGEPFIVARESEQTRKEEARGLDGVVWQTPLKHDSQGFVPVHVEQDMTLIPINRAQNR